MSRLLNEAWIEGLPDPIVENMEALNRYVINRACERIREIGDIGAADAHRLKNVMDYAAGDLRAIEREIARITRKNVQDIETIFEAAAAENIAFANTFFAARNMTPLKTYAQIAALDSFVRAAKAQAMDGVTNISNTHMIDMLGFKQERRVVPLREYYIKAIDRAIFFAQTGTVDYNTAIRETVREMAQSGLRRVAFESGYSRRLDSQARMNILEGVRRLNGEMMEEAGRRFGADGVELSAHALCAPDHLDIQGKQFSRAEFDRINGGLQRPIGTLNCGHEAHPIILGISRPVYSEEQLAELRRLSTEKVEWKGREMTRYEASQKQRNLENRIRIAKDERDALKTAGDELGAAQARKKSAKLQREYKAFCEKTGLTPRYERTRSMTGATVVKGKSLEKPATSGIIGLNKSKELPEVRGPKTMPPPKDVTQEYLRSAAPGKGSVTYEDGYRKSGHQTEIAVAEWVHKTFGGNITLLKEAGKDSVKRSDYMWNGALWELKGVSSVNSADKLLQHAIKQIQDNPGGVILNILKDIDMLELEKQLARRVGRSKIDSVDLMIVIENELKKVLRYKK